jgi:adenylylsulfate kinase
MVQAELVRRDYPVEVLDGDEMRKQFRHQLGFTKQDRQTNILLSAYIAELLNHHGIIVLAAFIAPYRDMRELCREQITHYTEIYVQCSLNTCIGRDVKGLYSKAIKGEITQFTGISDPYEEPEAPDLVLDTESSSQEESTTQVITFLEERGYIRKA